MQRLANADVFVARVGPATNRTETIEGSDTER